MHDTWYDWSKTIKKTKLDLINQGSGIVKIAIYLDELTEYYKHRGIKNDGSTRSQFVQEKYIMGFKKISIDKYVKLHLKNNPTENKVDLEKQLKNALKGYQKGVKCSCGNDIWVIGSAFVGNGCFTCITGESMPIDDFEIDSAINKQDNRIGQRHINDIKPDEIHGFFDDDGYEINSELIKKPTLCLTCVHEDDPNEEPLCNMTRFDQQGEQEFKCFSYKKIDF